MTLNTNTTRAESPTWDAARGIRRFTAEGRFECGLDEAVAGKVWAFVAAGSDGPGVARLGVAIANEPGYMPIPTHWCFGENWSAFEAYVDELNAAEGVWTKRQAIEIVCSTMDGRPCALAVKP